MAFPPSPRRTGTPSKPKPIRAIPASKRPMPRRKKTR